MLLSLTSVLLLCISALVVYRIVRGSSLNPLPPGPLGLPILGNALQIPAERQWLTFANWAKNYGNIMHFSMFGSSFIILSSPDVISELLEKRSATYSDRPVMPMAGWDTFNLFLSLLMAAGIRRDAGSLTNALNARRTLEYGNMYQSKVYAFMQHLMDSPENFRSHIRWLVGSIIFRISHGYNVKNLDDPVIQLAERANHEFSIAAAPGAFFVDTVPILRYLPDWFPGAGFKLKAKEWRKTMERMRDEPYDSVKDQMSRGVAQPSFTSSLIEKNPSPNSEEERLYKYVSSTFYSAGADTMVGSVESFFLAMLSYPEVQMKAQAEVDAIVGHGRFPTLSDRPDMPYVRALITEIHRWQPVAPLALQHKSTQEDVYNGYRIPAGSIILANSWAVLHDPSLYPTPSEFIPERYLSKTGSESQLNPDPRAFAFGYGRRVCPGQYLADDVLFIVVSSLLAMFNITKPMSSDGSLIEQLVEYTGIICHAGPFQCEITARSAEIIHMLEA